jgi:DNA-binding NtrC family response regulator
MSENLVSLVVADHKMPEMSGVEFLQQIKEKYPDVVRIMLTGHTEVDVATEAINRGEIYRFIGKPWDEEEIKSIVKQALEHYELATENKRMGRIIQRQNEILIRHKEELRTKVIQLTRTMISIEQEFKRLEQILEEGLTSLAIIEPPLSENEDVHTRPDYTNHSAPQTRIT